MVILTAAAPWTDGSPRLDRLRYRAPKRRGPSRKQVLAGYLVPAEIDETGKHWPEVWVEGQVPRAVRELGPGATLEQVADRLAIWHEDPEFLEVLLGLWTGEPVHAVGKGTGR